MTPFGLGIAEWAVIGAFIVFSLEVMGISRSARTIRRENADLKERNITLESEVRELAERNKTLLQQVSELKERSVDALFSAFKEHDERMSAAAGGLTIALNQLAAEIEAHEDRAQRRHMATLEVLERMVAKLA